MNDLRLKRRIDRLVKKYRLSPRPTGIDNTLMVYRLLDADSRCLYIGSTSNIQFRLKQHACSQYWWGDVAYITITEMPEGSTKYDATVLEYQEISTQHPYYNVEGNTRIERG